MNQELYPCIESTIDIAPESSTLSVRLWINQEQLPDSLREELGIKGKIFKFITNEEPKDVKSTIEYVVRNFPSWSKQTLNAVQVKRGDVGVVVYLVDFENHG